MDSIINFLFKNVIRVKIFLIVMPSIIGKINLVYPITKKNDLVEVIELDCLD